MANEITRLRYFRGEFLEEGDFQAEQAYHRRLRHLHNRWLHTHGIAFGLEVTYSAGTKEVTVSTGMGLVQKTEDSEELAKEVVLTAAKVIDLPAGANAVYYIALGFTDIDNAPAGAAGTEHRTVERADCRAVTAKPDNLTDLILAKFTLNAAGDAIISKDLTERIQAGMRGDVETGNLRVSIGGVFPNSWPSIRGAAPNRLQITAPQVDLSGDLSLTNGNIMLGPNRTVDGVDVSAHVANNGSTPVGSLGHVTAGDSHNHTAGQGGQISHSNLSGLGSASGHVTGGDNHDHVGGDGAQISHSSLSGLGSNSGHVTGGDGHDHTGGHGATIPWSATMPPAYASVEVPLAPGSIVIVRSSLGLTVARSSVGNFGVSWTTPAINPVIVITVKNSGGLICPQISTTTATSVQIFFRNQAGQLADPGGFMLLVY